MKRSEEKLARLFILMLVTLALACEIDHSRAQSTTNNPTNLQLSYADQGWSAGARDVFYLTSQGSRMMPYEWYKALRRLDVDALFGADQLQRYGYLPNERSRSNLPVG